jgi:hypothetical protein
MRGAGELESTDAQAHSSPPPAICGLPAIALRRSHMAATLSANSGAGNEIALKRRLAAVNELRAL